MINIAIIGCGQIGSRHLQALAFLEEEATIYLVDPNAKSRSIAYERFLDVARDNSIINVLKDSNIVDIDKKLDIAIVSSSSNERYASIENLLQYSKPNYMILEKFLFQKKEEYLAVNDLIEKYHIKTYVNQWVSSTYAFNRFAKVLGEIKNLKMKVYGNSWGLSCNSVHFIDYFDRLIGGLSILKVSNYNLDKILESNRAGYYEFTGSLSIESNENHHL